MSFLDEENMSSLIFYTDEAQALIVTDTLAVTDNGEPLSFVSKAGYIPQLRTIIAGTGAGGFSKEGANKRGNSSRLTQSFHFFMFEPIF
ncbi:hypothetical protein M8T17_25035, partial [Enterobacter hormaechei]|nr:hypothetical protein [Enterobacter hormaechei]